MLNIITWINELKTSTKHISCECKYKLDGRKWNSDQKLNNDKCQCECKQHNMYEKDYIWNPVTCSCKNNKYLANIMDDSVIMCDEIIESYNKETKSIRINFNGKKLCKQSFYILLAFL